MNHIITSGFIVKIRKELQLYYIRQSCETSIHTQNAGIYDQNRKNPDLMRDHPAQQIMKIYLGAKHLGIPVAEFIDSVRELKPALKWG